MAPDCTGGAWLGLRLRLGRGRGVGLRRSARDQVEEAAAPTLLALVALPGSSQLRGALAVAPPRPRRPGLGQPQRSDQGYKRDEEAPQREQDLAFHRAH